MILLLIFGNTDAKVITKGQGWILIFCTFAYIIYTIYEERILKNSKIDKEIIKEVENKGKHKTNVILIYMILGILGLKFGSDFVVDNAVLIAKGWGLSERFIGMTIVSIGTGLPEMITGIIAARHNETDLLLGNISGSNILNLCLLIGLGAAITPLILTKGFNSSVLMLIAVTVLLQFIATTNEKNELDSKRGFMLIMVYIIYIFSMF